MQVPQFSPRIFFNRNGTSRGPSQQLPWPPCPAPTQTVVVGRQQVQWAGVCPGLPCLSPQTDRQTDTTVAFIYQWVPVTFGHCEVAWFPHPCPENHVPKKFQVLDHVKPPV